MMPNLFVQPNIDGLRDHWPRPKTELQTGLFVENSGVNLLVYKTRDCFCKSRTANFPFFEKGRIYRPCLKNQFQVIENQGVEFHGRLIFSQSVHSQNGFEFRILTFQRAVWPMFVAP